ncbi:MAG: zinc ribbon domain-containing protein, partial [Aeriscardovia sp.]|nr:zinc ribbon domain-containing protein [Aeriscardovia sp.]
MALIKCKECGHEVSDKASACPNCGCPIQAADNTSVKGMEVKPLYVKEGNGKKWALLALLFLIIGGGCYLISRSSNNTLNDDNRINTVDTEPIYRDIASVNLSPKRIITNSLEELFNDVMIGKDGNGPEYDEKYFSTDFNRIYKEVEEIDMGYDGFFKAKFWDMEKDEAEMSISLEDVYNIKDNEAIAKVSFKISSSGYTKNLNEEIKVIHEN